MKRVLSLVSATVLASGFLLAACSGKEIPAGQDDGLGKDDGGNADGGECCPSGYDLYACTFPSGSSGFACHNPAMGCASSTTCGQGCDPVVSGSCGGDGGGGTLQWYSTCGYPVCFAGDGGPPVDAGVCPTEGTPCTAKGQSCGVASNDNCGVTYVCDDHDPKGMTCPISTRKYKDGIQYVDDAQLEALHAETLKMKLATYNYKSQVADPSPTHLGFIIEDQPQSLSVDQTHDRVDMYGYFSMIVASQQVQEKEIAELRSELKKSEERAAACKAAKK